VGLIRELILAPAAPLRLTLWVTEKVADEADRQQYSQGAVLSRLQAIKAAEERGEISEGEAREQEDQIIAGQMQGTGRRGEAGASTEEPEETHG
jgi:hypothetical protein